MSIPSHPPRRPQVGDVLRITDSGLTYKAPVDHLVGQYVHIAQLRFHVLDDWASRPGGWIAQPGGALVSFPATAP